jgi:hypothetical protein
VDLAETHGGPVCYGPTDGHGVIDADGRLLLDPEADDRLLAARLAHLVQHGAAPAADCAETLLTREARAWQVELRTRARLGVSDPACPVEAALGQSATPQELRAWLGTAAHPVAAALRTSHARRCARLR